jgi:hypothetical protein
MTKLISFATNIEALCAFENINYPVVNTSLICLATSLHNITQWQSRAIFIAMVSS